MLAQMEAQEHRRFLKTHLPADGLPLHDDVSYVHVARDGRDVCLSFHNHASGLSPSMLEAMDKAGLADETIGRPYPQAAADPAEHFHRWLTQGAVPGHADGSPTMSFFHFERTWWNERHRSNVLLVHYNDLKADLAGEMRRVAEFLDIAVPLALEAPLVDAARFEAMRRDGEVLMGSVAAGFQGGAERFFHQGTNERWRGVYRDQDLALYDAKIAAGLSPDCARWVAQGRRATADPRSAVAG